MRGIIFSDTVKPSNRLLLQLMARGDMRIGEVLKLRPKNMEEHNLMLPGVSLRQGSLH